MKILILSFYFPPDLSAGSFRVSALVKALGECKQHDLKLDVVTTMPNRYHNLSNVAPEVENHGWLNIRRIELPSHKSGIIDQAHSFVAFALRVNKELRHGEWDVVFATSSRLMTAVLGAKIARSLNTPLYLDIRDLFTDTMSDLLFHSPLRALVPGFRALEKRTFRQAARINLVSPGFLSHAEAVAPMHNYRLFTNGIDSEFLDLDFGRLEPEQSGPPLIVYAGNMGDGQGLHNVLPDAALSLGSQVSFRLIGGGGRRQRLEDVLMSAGVKNVELLNPVPRTALYDHYRNADILFLHLNNHDAFLKVLPSKIFEYAATGKPILAGVAGQAAEFLQAEIPGCEVFRPCDSAGMVESIHRLLRQPRKIDRSAFCAKYSRKTIMQRMAEDILELASKNGRR